MWCVAGSVLGDDHDPGYLAGHLAASGVPRLLLRLPQAALLASGAGQTHPPSRPRTELAQPPLHRHGSLGAAPLRSCLSRTILHFLC